MGKAPGLSYKARRRWALVILLIGLPLYIVLAVTLTDWLRGRYPVLPALTELVVFVALGIVWALPFKFIFKGSVRPTPMRAPKTDCLPGQAGCVSLVPMAEDDDRPGAPPCFQHELIGGHPVDPETWRDVARFRRAERTRLYAARKALGIAGLRTQSARIMAGLGEMLGPLAGQRIAVFWPIRAEPDLRDWMAEADRARGRDALARGGGKRRRPDLSPLAAPVWP